MASFWERAGERVGYAMAAVLLGPYAAAVRHERRVLRTAFREWIDELEPVVLTPRTTGSLRRVAKLLAPGGTIPFEAEIDPNDKRASIDLSASLPHGTSVTIAKGYPMMTGSRAQLEESSLDAAASEAIVHDLARSALSKMEAFRLSIREDRVLLEIVAPRSSDVWRQIGEALGVLVETWTQRWTTYR
jgi:hypothetical protein